MDAMVERIEKLERSVRRFRLTGGAVVCLGVVGLVMGQKAEPKDTPVIAEKIAAQEVWAERYVLVFGGELRGFWTAEESRSQLTIFPPGNRQTPSVNISVTADGPTIGLHMNQDSGSMWACDANGTAAFNLLQKGGKIVSSWVATLAYGSKFSLNDKDGRERAVLGRTVMVDSTTGAKSGRPESSLVLFDEEGTVLHQVP